MRGVRHALRREVVKGVRFKCWGEFGKIGVSPSQRGCQRWSVHCDVSPVATGVTA